MDEEVNRAKERSGALLTASRRGETVGPLERPETHRAGSAPFWSGSTSTSAPTFRRCSGCVNDVALVRSLLKQYFDVPNEDIRVVVNRRATKAAILHRLRDMISRGRAGRRPRLLLLRPWIAGARPQRRRADRRARRDHLPVRHGLGSPDLHPRRRSRRDLRASSRPRSCSRRSSTAASGAPTRAGSSPSPDPRSCGATSATCRPRSTSPRAPRATGSPEDPPAARRPGLHGAQRDVGRLAGGPAGRPRTTWTAGRTGSSPTGAAGSSPSTSSRSLA